MDIFGFSFEKVVVLGALAGLLLGPERLARIVTEGSRLLKQLRQRADVARAAIQDEFGDDIVDIDWQRLDPRRYDPRRIIADALLSGSEAAQPARTPPYETSGAAPAATRIHEERK